MAGQDAGHSGAGQGRFVLIANKPPAVNADTHDHGARRPSTNDATSRTRRPPQARPRPASSATPARPPRRRAPAPSARSAPRSAQHATGTAAANRAPSPAAPPAAPRPADTPHRPAAPRRSAQPSFRPARHTSGRSTCVARHASSRQRPRRGRSRRSPSRVRNRRNRAQPQPPQHAHATTRTQQPAGGEIRLDHSTIVCDDEDDVLQRRQEAPSLHRVKVSARGPQSTGSPPSCRPLRPTATRHHHPR
jgi:hypothetical protein